MTDFGGLLGRVIAEILTLLEGTLSHYVNITVDGNVSSYSLSSTGQLFCQNWSNLLVSWAGALNGVMNALWTTKIS